MGKCNTTVQNSKPLPSEGNCMPLSVKDRFTVDFEKLFFFTKSKKYYFEQQLRSAEVSE